MEIWSFKYACQYLNMTEGSLRHAIVKGNGPLTHKLKGSNTIYLIPNEVMDWRLSQRAAAPKPTNPWSKKNEQ
jgi:hypothetical protein